MARASGIGGRKVKPKAGKAIQAKGRKAAKTAGRVARVTKSHKNRSISEMEAEVEELLRQQTATTEILRVINASQGDLKPVFDTILEKAHSLCDVPCGSLQLIDGDYMREVAVRGQTKAFEQFLRQGYRISDRVRQSLNAGQVVHNVDMAELRTPDEPAVRASVELGGIRTLLALPLSKNGVMFGRIMAARQEVRPFTDRQIGLLKTFADQAVIAIENARLFNETKEALERQTATAEILRVIAKSSFELRPVYEAIVFAAAKLFQREIVMILLCDETTYWPVANAGMNGLSPVPHHPPVKIDGAANFPSRAILTQRNIHLPDWSLVELPQHEREIHTLFGVNSSLMLPMLRDGKTIGVLAIAGTGVRAFNETEIALAESFRDQAIIAIENARMFHETKEALERQTATADILKVIASSPSDLQPVFEAIAERSNRLVNALSTTVFMLEDDMMHLRAFTPTAPEADAALHAAFPAPLTTFSWGESILRAEIYRVIDSEQEPEDLRNLARLRGWRSCVCVPLLREGKPIGMIGPTRTEPGPFSDHHIQLLQTFADQAVIAISNVGLFKEVQERTRALSDSLDDLRSAQDRLVQTEKLASLGQLTAGIAHEIKNPLNFVNNFSALSAELVDELDETLAPAPLDPKTREDVGELTEMLKSNLEKVVQHGKRADSIVKNMLLHSREGSGQQRAVDINALLDEAVSLAYHGARAEKPEFNITLQRDFDPVAGSVELFPQEMTRVFLNLISNGFYASTKRKADSGENFEPSLSATTKDLGGSVEIRIRDNGSGIPPEVKEKIFNPFFTTKPAGEGTGLGLSMSHDIIVKQHGGSIDVVTEPGQFTEFVVVLPRARAPAKKIEK